MKLPLAMCHFGGSFLETSFWLRVTLVEVSSKLPLATGHFGGSFLETLPLNIGEVWWQFVGTLLEVLLHFGGSLDLDLLFCLGFGTLPCLKLPHIT